MSSPHPQPPPALVEVHASYFFLAFLLAIFKPKASIDGGPPFPVRWGATPVPVPPGRHLVEVWVPYLFLPFMGRNGAVVDVPPGGAVRVRWRAPWIVFMRGSVRVEGPVPMHGAAPNAPLPPAAAPPVAAPVGAPGGWHPDPSGRHQQRYYDGTAWTEHVADGGVQGTDPIPG